MVARRAGDAAAGVGAGAAHIKPPDRPTIAAVAKQRARGPELVEAHGSVHDIAADQAEHAFEPLGRQARLADDAGAKAGGLSLDGVADRVGRRVFLIVPEIGSAPV